MNKVWLITGASSGLGRALAEHVLAAGDSAIVTARRIQPLQELSARFAGRALAVSADVTDPDGRTALVDRAIEQFGRIDVLANVAGRGACGAAEEFSSEQLREQLELNFFAAAELTQAVLPVMRAQGSGRIVNVTSVAGLVSIAACATYCAAKFALEGWSEALAYEVAPLGIRVLLVEPGAFRTEFCSDVNMRPEGKIAAYAPVVDPIRSWLNDIAGKQIGDPAKCAALIVDAVNSETPPQRLMLGSDAYQLWERTIAARNADLAAWRKRGEATAADDALLIPIGGQ